MAQGNYVEITGNLARDPELRFTPTGAAVANFGVAVNRRWRNQQTNDWEEEVSFFEVTCWRQLAENVTESITKGDRVTVVGRLEQQTWDDKNTSEKRSKVQIVADDVCPSLRWATVQITKNERRAPDDGAPPRTEPPAGSYNDDEEPF